MVAPALLVHGVLARSAANGPGLRSVIWTQGCTLGCAGCFNPETHALGGVERDLHELAEWAAGNGVEGVTISGGEPLEQADAVLALARHCRARGLSVIVLTGFSWRFLTRRRPALVAALSTSVDIVLAGRYSRTQHLGAGLRGSANKTVELLSSRYRAEDLDATPEAEIVIAPDGSVVSTGVAPLMIGQPA
jgi:anaerobic ribonucleoside-triphosphate reductase activating protein